MKSIGHFILRPHRDVYDSQDLGPKLFVHNSKLFRRSDIILKNSRGLMLQCSYFEPIHRLIAKLPVVVYCHGNCGSRLDALEIVEFCLPKDICCFIFDFSGSGLSEGEYVTLGYNEAEDIVAVINYLENIQMVSSICL